MQDKSIVLKSQGYDYEFYSLMGGAAPTHITDPESGHRISLIPIVRQQKNYWISLFISLKGTVSDISSVSMGVYTGNPSETIEKLFRAEWAQEELSNGHAQPHWHFHTKEDSDWEQTSWEQEQNAVSFTGNENRDKQDLKKIHFAMAAQWHSAPQSHLLDLKRFDEDQVMNWICHTYEYIIHQLSYLENKSAL
jgi:hypothetical protein